MSDFFYIVALGFWIFAMTELSIWSDVWTQLPDFNQFLFTFQVTEKWAESGWSKRMVMKARRQGLNDFDRFKLMKAKSARNKILAKAVAIKKNKMSKAGKL